MQNYSFDNRFHFKSIKLLAPNDIQALLMSAGRYTVFINITPYFMFCTVTSCFYWPAWVLCPYKVDVWARRIKRWIWGVEMEPFALFCIKSEIERNISSVHVWCEWPDSEKTLAINSSYLLHMNIFMTCVEQRLIFMTRFTDDGKVFQQKARLSVNSLFLTLMYHVLYYVCVWCNISINIMLCIINSMFECMI